MSTESSVLLQLGGSWKDILAFLIMQFRRRSGSFLKSTISNTVANTNFGILRFYCHPKVNGVEQPSGHLILPENTKKLFRERDLVTYEYSDLSIQVEETMFQLVQKGMPLTPAERMRALSTDWAKFAKEFEADFPKIINRMCFQAV